MAETSSYVDDVDFAGFHDLIPRLQAQVTSLQEIVALFLADNDPTSYQALLDSLRQHSEVEMEHLRSGVPAPNEPSEDRSSRSDHSDDPDTLWSGDGESP